jgi:UDP-2,3-diacylglucosamine hydrolase
LGASIGLIAGLGLLPFELAEAARRHGHRIAAVGLEGFAAPELAARVERFEMLPLGQLERLFGFLRGQGVKQVVLAGKVPKAVLFGMGGRLQLDARATALLASLPDRRDDSILLAVAAALEAEGFELLAQADLAPELLAGEGRLNAVEATASQLADLAFAWPIAKALGALDIGQTVVAKGRAVMALEAIEGTDAAIRRGCELAGGGVCVVKVAKPGQDPRFDVPVVGLETVRALAVGGGGCLAVEAGSTLLLEREALLREADAAGIALLGVDGVRPPGGAG